MTPEQEKAIYRLNLHKDTQVQDDCCIVNAKDIEIVLSMIENQKERIYYLMRSIERKEQSLIEEHEENIQCYTMIEKKDKIIDLMANKLALYCEINCEEDIKTNKEQIKQYFENKVST